jgi:putative transposase
LPIARPMDWVARVNRALSRTDLEALKISVIRSRPFGGEAWQRRVATRLGLESTFRPRGRPKKQAQDARR